VRRRAGTDDVKARFEVSFLSDDQVSVFIETDLEPGPELEVLETTVFLTLAAGVIANLPKKLASALCQRLREFPVPTRREDIPATVDGLDLVLPHDEIGSKGFEGTLAMKGGLPVARLKPRGFRLFGGEVQEYSQTATMAVLHHLLLGFTSAGQVVLVEAARYLALAGTLGGIKMTNHSKIAWEALESGLKEAELRS
jgi:hypothetical protein